MNPRRSLGARLGWDGEVVGLPEPRQEFVMDAEGKELLPHMGEHWWRELGRAPRMASWDLGWNMSRAGWGYLHPPLISVSLF